MRSKAKQAIWDIIDAKKVKFRIDKDGNDTHQASEWQITFQDLHSGKKQTLIYSAEHRPDTTATSHKYLPASLKAELRGKRYPSGASGIVKKLSLKEGQTPYAGIPSELALKSIYPRQNVVFLSETKPVSGSVTERDILQDFGSPFYIVKRSRVKNGRMVDRVAAIQRYNGNGNDLLECILIATSDTESEVSADLLKKITEAKALLEPLQNTKDRLRCIVELLAHYQHFHNEVKRPVLDIKLENIMPLSANVLLAGLTPIDLDSSFSDEKIWSDKYFSIESSDYADNDNLTAFDLPCSIDFNTLATVLTHGFFALEIPEFRIAYNDYYDKFYIHADTWKAKDKDDSIKLIAAMSSGLKTYRSNKWNTAEQLITDTLGKNSAAHNWYKAKLNNLTQRANARKARATAAIKKTKQPSSAIKTAALAAKQRRALARTSAVPQPSGAGGGAGATYPQQHR